MRSGHLRRHRRPGAQEADAGGLRPGQPRAAPARLLPGRVRPTRLGRPGLRQDRARRGHGARADAVPRGGLEAALRGIPLRPGRLLRRRRLQPAARHHRRARPRARHGRQPRLLPLDPAALLPGRGRTAQGARARRELRRLMAPRRGGEAVRPRPEERPGAERDRLGGVPAGVGVPDRPLPGQGDGAEHPGPAVRQPAVRAGLERQLRRPRADHHGRGHRHRRPRRLLRRHRRCPRRDPEPPAAADGADRDGGAGLVRRAAACGSRSRRSCAASGTRRGSTCTPPAVSTSPAGPVA